LHENSVGHSNCLSRVESTRIQDPIMFPGSFLRLLAQPFIRDKKSYGIKSSIQWNIHLHQFSRKTINVAHIDFKLDIWCGLKIIVCTRELLWSTLIGLFNVVVRLCDCHSKTLVFGLQLPHLATSHVNDWC
jgi:hypothetical protein